MKISEVRQKYLDFFKARGHAVIPSAPLVPENDPTTLFTSSGMQPLVPYLLGEKHPLGTRLADSQKSFRAEDIEEVGDNRHTTFFEMLGNWSLGDYFKQEQLPWIFEFLTDKEQGLGLDPQKLYVTVFAGDSATGIEPDTESVEIWKRLFKEKGIEAEYVSLGSEAKGSELGMQGGRIFSYDVKKNWWSRSGTPDKMPVGEPGGPDSEIFYDFGTEHDAKFGAHCHPNCDCGRFMEIGNSVFMEYKKTENGFEKLTQRNVDFGGGLERMAAATLNDPDIFHIDVFQAMAQKFNVSTDISAEDLRSLRIMLDHTRAAIFLIGDAGIEPSNKERGYIVRRLLRRAILNAEKFGSIAELVQPIAEFYKDVYPRLAERNDATKEIIRKEEEKFKKTLKEGRRLLAEMAAEGQISGKQVFDLFQSYGYPIELSIEELKLPKADEEKILKEAKEEFEKHKELSRTASAGQFKGGLADHSETNVRYHTVTHLMNAALRKVLGGHVWQKGSNINPERTRFDFTHPEKVTSEQLAEVEKLVNEWIARDLTVKQEMVPKEEAEKLGAIGVFGEKYPDTVSVYTVYDPKTNEVVSREYCGGPHVSHTGAIGKFKITKEEAVGSGVRRIKAIIE